MRNNYLTNYEKQRPNVHFPFSSTKKYITGRNKFTKNCELTIMNVNNDPKDMGSNITK